MMKLTVPAVFLLLAAAGTAHANPAKSMGQFKDWNAASYKNGNSQRCYISSTPTAAKPEQLRHGDVFFFVQTSDGKASQTETSFQTGYEFAKDSVIRVTIGDEEFQMLTLGQGAWLKGLDREGDLLAAMKAGSSMVLEATSARGNDTSYTFSLDGVTAAARLLEQCS
ncbi:invasion associated locus B family protein [Bosea sp. (in: a-proteobacteria)]|uniref:invasion associated locus B family protein n=1 Tax=Bosea sp. (in: a-proteobacteria) TaxID=1871050 RepID=UPI002FC5D64C